MLERLIVVAVLGVLAGAAAAQEEPEQGDPPAAVQQEESEPHASPLSETQAAKPQEHAAPAPVAPEKPGPLPDFALRIEVSLDTAEWKIEGVERAMFFNRSAESLGELVFLLPPNAYANDAALAWRNGPDLRRGEVTEGRLSRFGYMDIRRVSARGGAALSGEAVRIDGTVMRVALPEPLPSGGSADLEIDFLVKLPHRAFSPLGVAGRHVDAVRWYPRPARLEAGRWIADLEDPAAFAGCGFFEVVLTLPSHFNVAANGTLREDRMDNALKHLRFEAGPVPDFSWTADPISKTVEGLHQDARIVLAAQPYLEERAQALLDTAMFCLDFRGRFLGSSPIGTLVITTTPYGTGEPASAPGFFSITQPYPTQRDEDRSGIEPPERALLGAFALQSLPARIVGGPGAEIPLREGLALYLHLKLLEARGGGTHEKEGARAYLEDRLRTGFLNQGFGLLPSECACRREAAWCGVLRPWFGWVNLISVIGYRKSPLLDPADAGTLLGYRLHPEGAPAAIDARAAWTGSLAECAGGGFPAACFDASFAEAPGQARPCAAARVALALRTLENHAGWEPVAAALQEFLQGADAGRGSVDGLLAAIETRASKNSADMFKNLLSSPLPVDFTVAEVRCRPLAPAKGFRTQTRLAEAVAEHPPVEEGSAPAPADRNPFRGLIDWGSAADGEPETGGDGAASPAGIERPKTTAPTPIAKPLQSGLTETVPSERLIAPARTAPAIPMRGEEAGPGLRELLESLLSRLDGLADRPVELSVTTNIDGRKVAEAVYKDLRERKIRNYETL